MPHNHISAATTDTSFPDNAPGTDASAAKRPSLPRPRVEPKSLPDQIADELGRNIVDGHFAPGTRLIETTLAEHFNVSRSSIRDAFRLLERRRVIEILPRRGAFVRRISMDTIADIFNVRIALLAAAARYMAIAQNSYIDTLERRVNELKAMAADENTSPKDYLVVLNRATQTIAKGSGNELIAEVLDDLVRHTVWTSIWIEPPHYLTSDTRRKSAREMVAVLEAVRAGNPELADREMRIAMEYNRDHAMLTLSKLRSETFDVLRQNASSNRDQA
jgi:DNA-binding GntR family transcriptional regulator